MLTLVLQINFSLEIRKTVKLRKVRVQTGRGKLSSYCEEIMYDYACICVCTCVCIDVSVYTRRVSGTLRSAIAVSTV
jgi:hypothetical protein